MTNQPRWFAEWLEDRIDAGARRAHPDTCRTCRQPVIVGQDHDVMAFVVTVDTNPADTLTEVVARLDGRQTYDLVWDRLEHRMDERVAGQPADICRYPVLVEHRCRDTAARVSESDTLW